MKSYSVTFDFTLIIYIACFILLFYLLHCTLCALVSKNKFSFSVYTLKKKEF